MPLLGEGWKKLTNKIYFRFYFHVSSVDMYVISVITYFLPKNKKIKIKEYILSQKNAV
jgi:hypothetical protein